MWFDRHQVLLNAEINFGTDLERTGDGQIQRAAHESFGGVDDRNDRVIGRFGFDLAKRFVDGRTRFERGRSSEVFCGGGVAERAFRPQKRDDERLF